MERNCGKCLIRQQAGNGFCPVFQEKVEDGASACRKYIGHDSAKCDFCGALMPGKPQVVIMEDGTVLQSCAKCGDSIGTCATCAQAKLCGFETNPIQIPKQVQKVVQQGNMRMQTVIRNPEREKETCMKGCPCWDEDTFTCLRQSVGCCKSWRYE